MVRVIDASVAIKWFVIEPGREAALDVLRQVLAKPRAFAVPELFYFEIANVVHRLIPKPSRLQRSLLHQLMTIGLQRYAMTPAWFDAIREIQSRGLSGYDAAYVALAQQLGGTWLTFDHTAHRTIAHLKCSEALPFV